MKHFFLQDLYLSVLSGYDIERKIDDMCLTCVIYLSHMKEGSRWSRNLTVLHNIISLLPSTVPGLDLSRCSINVNQIN